MLQLCCKLVAFVSVRILEPGSYTGVKNEAAGNWNLMQTVDPLVRIDKIPGKVTESDVVMNHIPRYSHSNRAAMSKFLLTFSVCQSCS
jgi:hypothetical protein